MEHGQIPDITTFSAHGARKESGTTNATRWDNGPHPNGGDNNSLSSKGDVSPDRKKTAIGKSVPDSKRARTGCSPTTGQTGLLLLPSLPMAMHDP